MLEVSLDVAVRSKLKLAKPVYGASGQIMLQKGVVLTASYARGLRKFGFYSVFVEGGKVDVHSPVREVVRSRASKVLYAFTQGSSHNINVRESAALILDDVLALGGVLDNINSLSLYDGYTFAHSIDVSILSIAIASEMGYGRRILLEIAMGALLHDIGKIKIPQNTINKIGKLTDDEMTDVKNHTLIGYELAKSHPQLSKRSTTMILEHHERYDGSGYPHGKRDRDINLSSVICGISDVYNAMTTNRCYRKAYPAHEVYQYILGLGNTHFDYSTVQAFAKVIMPYPKGRMVRISDGRIAQVAENSSGHPYLPLVIFLEEETYTPVDLYKEGLTIKEPLTNEEVEALIENGRVPVMEDRELYDPSCL
ncbi:MAG: HD-GYP domain-containing protein [Firmicutes bacterium]|nr:HD-GYP domain-containing protein [Bacillota bacterium]